MEDLDGKSGSHGLGTGGEPPLFGLPSSLLLLALSANVLGIAGWKVGQLPTYNIILRFLAGALAYLGLVDWT